MSLSLRPLARKIKRNIIRSGEDRHLAAILKNASAASSPHQLFGAVPDEYWYWLNTEGKRRSEFLAKFLPGLPPDELQINFTGAAGDATLRAAFDFYLIVKSYIEKVSGKPLSACDNILDFGCGWGRIIRFFLKDLEGDHITGIDAADNALQAAKEGNRFCRFELIDTKPPTALPSASFDLIYCYSVYSHLSEEMGTAWLHEFARLLKPGGLFIATTRSREFIVHCEHDRQEQKRNPTKRHFVAEVLSDAFPENEKVLADFDAGKLCFSRVGGGGVLSSDFYGEAAIPKAYAQNEWGKVLRFVDFVEGSAVCDQAIIVMQK